MLSFPSLLSFQTLVSRADVQQVVVRVTQSRSRGLEALAPGPQVCAGVMVEGWPFQRALFNCPFFPTFAVISKW